MPQSGYYYLRARYYDPTIGRFVSRDSYAGNLRNPSSLNRYSYAHNNPVNLIDPSGHDPIPGQMLEGALEAVGGFALAYGGGTALAAVSPATGGTTIALAVGAFGIGTTEIAIGSAKFAQGWKGIENDTPGPIGIAASAFTNDPSVIAAADALQNVLFLPLGVVRVPTLIKSFEGLGNIGELMKFWEQFRLVPQAQAAGSNGNK